MSQKEKSKTVQSSPYLPFQQDVAKKLTETYSPYIGTGTIGGLSDLEEKSLGMLRSADIWSPMTKTATGLLTGETGAEPITGEKAAKTFTESVERPAMKKWHEEWKPSIKEEYAGPGYWSGARAKAVTEGGEDVGQWLGTERAKWMWDVEQANRAVDEAKAGRALSALGVTPSALSGWTGTLFGTGAQAREIANAITDPEVLQVISTVLGLPMAPRVTKSTQTPSEFQQAANWAGMLSLGMMGLGGLGGGGGGGGSTGQYVNPTAQGGFWPSPSPW